MNKIKVLIVDDSALIRQMLTQILNSDEQIEVIATAPDPLIAREKIKKLNPDVLTLDVEMPKMDGVTFLRNLMRLRPMPVIMISTLTEQGASITLEAMALGAVDCVAKPKTDVSNTLKEYADDIIAKVKMAAKANVKPLEKPAPATKTSNKTSVQKLSELKLKASNKIIAIGSSTGGTEALKDVVRTLPASTPPIIVSQHLPAAFTESFTRHVDQAGAMTACVAQNNQRLEAGHIYIAPGDKHLEVVKDGVHYVCRLNDGPLVNRHKPSVEVMFKSVAQNVGSNAIGVMLTGMGADGASAMKEMRDAGAKNIVQDEASSVVWGMPGEAYKLGAADHVVPLEKIAAQIIALL